MQRRATQHEAPESLRHRHPYDPEEHVDTFDPYKPKVRHAFGRRAASKLLQVLVDAEATENEVLDALTIFIKNGSSQENATHIIGEGAVETAAQALSHESPKVRGQVAKLFIHLAKHWAGRERMALNSAISLLAERCGKEETDEIAQRHSAMALAMYCQTIDGWQLLADNGEVFPKLAEALACNPSVIHPLACITSQFKEGATTFIQNGGVPHLVTLSKRLTEEWKAGKMQEKSTKVCSIDFDTLTDTLVTIRGVAVDDQGKSELVAQGAVPILVSLHGYENSSVRIPASGTFPLLAAVELSSLTAFLNCGFDGVHTLVNALRDSTHSVRRNVRTAISYLSANSETKQRFVFELIRQGHVEELSNIFEGNACAEVCVCLSFPGAHKIRKTAVEVIHRLTVSTGHIDPVANALHILPRLIGVLCAAADGGCLPEVGTPEVSIAEVTGFETSVIHELEEFNKFAEFSSEVDNDLVKHGLEVLFSLCSQFIDCRDTAISVLTKASAVESGDDEPAAPRFHRASKLHPELQTMLNIENS